jgi:hypothetical protein
MSRKMVAIIIGKTVIDGEFREALFANPDKVLAGYDLTEQERASFKTIAAEDLEAFAGTLDERLCKAILAILAPRAQLPSKAPASAPACAPMPPDTSMPPGVPLPCPPPPEASPGLPPPQGPWPPLPAPKSGD